MEDNLEILFCEICNESVPETDLENQRARRIKGKVLGACCLPEAETSRSGSGAAGAGGMTTVAGFVLAGVAAATIYLDSRVAKVEEEMGRSQGAVTQRLKSQGDQWIDLQGRIDNLMPKDGNTALAAQVTELGSRLTAIATAQEQVQAAIRGHDVRFVGLEEGGKRVLAGQGRMTEAVKAVENEVLRLERDIARLAASPREAAAKPDPLPGQAPDGGEVEEAPPAGLPPKIAHHVTRLKDADEGNRFDAVDNLVAAKDARVVPHLLPMLKDPDIFVRRLTAEGLSQFKSKEVVTALIVALADGESLMRHTAYDSLKKLTGQSIRFDPDGSASARNQGRRKWEDWWEKNKAGF